MAKIILYTIEAFGLILALIGFVNIVLWLIYKTYELANRIIWQKTRFLQWLNLQGLPKEIEEKIRRVNEYEKIILSAITVIPDVKIRTHLTEMLNEVPNEVK